MSSKVLDHLTFMVYGGACEGVQTGESYSNMGCDKDMEQDRVVQVVWVFLRKSDALEA